MSLAPENQLAIRQEAPDTGVFNVMPDARLSTNTIWLSSMFLTARMRVRVVWGLSDTIATFVPTMRLSSVDLPAFGRPTRDAKPARAIYRV